MALTGSEKVHVVSRDGLPVARSLDELAGTADFDGLNIITKGGLVGAPITVAVLKAGLVPAGHAVPSPDAGTAHQASDLNDHFNPPGYTAQAVHFDGATFLSGTIEISDTPLLSVSVFAKVSSLIPSSSFGVDATNYNLNVDMVSQGTPSVVKGLRFLVGDALFNNWLDVAPSLDNDFTDQWVWFAGSVNTNAALGERLFGSFANGADIVVGGDTGSGDAFAMHFSGLTFGFPDANDAPYYIGDLANWWFAPGQYLDFSDSDVQAKFRDPLTGKPVFLGDNGELPTGVAPKVFFAGGASTFPTNQGSGGAFTLTGTLTDASSSPSD